MMIQRLFTLVLLPVAMLACSGAPQEPPANAEPKSPAPAAPPAPQNVLPRPAPPFKGKIGRTTLDSTPDFPKEVQAPPGAPNVLYVIASKQKLAPGKHTLRFDFTYDGNGRGKGGKGGKGVLLVDGKPAAEGRIERTVGTRFSLDETFDVGAGAGTPLLEDYATKMPYAFSGRLGAFTIELR